MSEVKLFEDRKIRTAWNEDEQEWYFSIVDVVGALTDSADSKQYVKRMRARDAVLNEEWGTICTPVKMLAPDGALRITNAADMKGILRIIQSIPSKKAEPFKLWLAQVGAERIDETIDPEIAIDRALQTYQKKGYSEGWIRQRLLAIDIRKELTDEWQQRGVEQGKEFAILTDDITRAWSGMSTREYKSGDRDHKGFNEGDVLVYGGGGIMTYVDTAACEGPSFSLVKALSAISSMLMSRSEMLIPSSTP